jgi:TPR repeat protein
MVGAFSLATGTKAQVKAAAEIFGAQAGAASNSDKSVRNTEGDAADCAKASPDSEKPPPQCGAAVRLVLGALGPSTKGKPADAKAADPKPVEADVVPASEGSCPKGLVLAEGKCTVPTPAVAFQCNPNDEKACSEQCGKGHLGSCAALGVLYTNGRWVSRDYTKAREAAKKACDGGEMKGCLVLGLLDADGLGTRKDEAAAAALFDKACAAGEASGCSHLAHATVEGRGVPADPAKAASLFQKACDGGDDHACGRAGKLFADGKGVARDPAKAAELFKRACDGSDSESCDALGQLHEVGSGVRKDPILARLLYQRGCFRASGPSCADLGRLEYGFGGGGDRDAKRYFEQACTWRDTVGCAALKVMFGDGRPVFPDVARQQQMLQSCHGGNARDCATVGLLDVASNNKPQGVLSLENACQRGDGFACAVVKKVK